MFFNHIIGLNRTMSSNVRNMTKKVDFYYDVISPYTWFAFEVLMRYKKHWDIHVELKPMFLAGVTHATGNSAPMLVPNKALYMVQDLKRCVKYFNVPLNIVEDPFNLIMVKGSLIPNRFLISTSLLYPEKLEDLSRALWMETWNKDQDFTDMEVLRRAAKSVGLDNEQIKTVASQIKDKKVKDKLKQNTEAAVEYGAFGSPTFIVHTEEPKLFFGSDRFPLIAQELGEEWKGPNPDLPQSPL